MDLGYMCTIAKNPLEYSYMVTLAALTDSARYLCSRRLESWDSLS
jgi:hypothetical protein